MVMDRPGARRKNVGNLFVALDQTAIEQICKRVERVLKLEKESSALKDGSSLQHANSDHQPVAGFFGEYCAETKTDLATFIAVGVTPGQAWANAKIALALESSQMREDYQIGRISGSIGGS